MVDKLQEFSFRKKVSDYGNLSVEEMDVWIKNSSDCISDWIPFIYKVS